MCTRLLHDVLQRAVHRRSLGAVVQDVGLQQRLAQQQLQAVQSLTGQEARALC